MMGLDYIPKVLKLLPAASLRISGPRVCLAVKPVDTIELETITCVWLQEAPDIIATTTIRRRAYCINCGAKTE